MTSEYVYLSTVTYYTKVKLDQEFQPDMANVKSHAFRRLELDVCRMVRSEPYSLVMHRLNTWVVEYFTNSGMLYSLQLVYMRHMFNI